MIHPEKRDEPQKGEGALHEDRGEHDAENFGKNFARQSGSVGEKGKDDQDQGYADDRDHALQDRLSFLIHKDTVPKYGKIAMAGNGFTRDHWIIGLFFESLLRRGAQSPVGRSGASVNASLARRRGEG